MIFRCFSKTITSLVAVLLACASCLPASAQEGRDYPLGPIGGSYRVTGNSSLAKISAITAGEPGATAGLQVGDFIYGAFGQTFTPTGGQHYGVSQELGFAVDRAEGGDGMLPLLVVRAGTGGMTVNVQLAAAGAFGVAYPRNSSKYAGVYETAVADLHTRAMNGNGSMGYLTGFTGLALLGHPNWNDTTGAKPYRLSINKIRDFAINQINAWGYAPTENKLLDGSAIPNPSGGPSNWELGQLVMFLSEYYAKTADSSVLAPLQRGAEMCGNTVQWWKQPAENANGYSPEYAQVAGMSSHGGVTGDYMHQGWYCGINMCGVHNFNGMAFARRAGVNMNVRPRDGHYFGFNLNQGDTIPASIANALPSSITLPPYAADPVRGSTITDPFWYDPSVNQKFLMQLNFLGRRSLGGDGCVGYAPEAITNYDAGGRTPGTLLGMAMYQQDVGGLDAADLNRMEMLKSYITNAYMRQQEAHVYCVGGQVFQALATPYLSDRQQRFFMDNWRFFFALSRTSTNGVRYFQARGMADSGAYLDDNHCASLNIALPYGIANGRYSLIPGYNTNRSLANFKSPVLMWPSLAARTCTVNSSSQAFQVDVCDGDGNVLSPGSYTATWSHVSGPATATFGPNNTADTTVTFPGVSTTAYRIRLTVTRAGVPDLTEDIDVTRANATVPVTNAIATHPANQIAVPGGSASFTVGVTGSGPFVYQWRLNGTAYWGSSTSPTLSLANLGSGSLGSYDCVVSTPTGLLTSNTATLTFNATLARTPGGLRREIWTPSYGSAISDLTGNANFPLFPSSTAVVDSAEASGYGDNYGQKLSGWIKPPVSGSYRFFLSSDDASQLWLSTDDTAANKVKIADFASTTGFRSYSSGAQSVPVNLLGGRKYYIEILHKEAGGGDHVSVAWQMPGEVAPSNGSDPVPGVYLEYEQYLPLLTNHWKFDETSGTACTDTVGGATATLSNGPTRVAGILGTAVSFNGVNQSATATVNVSETVYAVSLWFRTTQASGGLYSVTDGGSAHDRHIYLNGGNISARIWSEETIASTGQNYGDGQWHHIVHTFGGAIGGQKLYVDGVQVAAGGKSQSDFNNQTLIRIGYSVQSPVPYFNGQIDDVRIYNAGLSTQDASTLYGDGINAAPQLSPGNFTVVENAPAGTTLGNLTATDANAGQTIAYSIVGGNVGGHFALDSATGALTVVSPVDFETSDTYVLTLTATDSGTPARSVTTTATIAVTNVNEAPVFASNPVIGHPGAPAIAYSGDLTAVDPEGGGAVTYLKVDGPPWLSVASDGTLSGTPAAGDVGTNNFTVRATDSTSMGADWTLQINVVNVAVNPVWTNPSGGSWPVAGNWLSNGVANGQAATADFSTLNLTADTTVTLDGTRTIGGLKFGDIMASHNWTLATGTGGTLTLAVASGKPVVAVASQSATITAALAGTQGFLKTGAGTLTLGSANTLTGSVTISQGTLAVARHNAITVTSLALGDANTGANPTGFTIENGVSATMNPTIINTTSFGTGHTITLNAGSALGANAAALACTLNLAGNVPLTLKATNTGGHSTAQDWSGRITGTGIFAGSTSLILNGISQPLRLSFGNSTTPNTFTGGVLIQGNVSTQNQSYSGNTAANQNNGFRTNDLTVATNSTWTVVWGGETIASLNGQGNVSLNCQSALNNIGLTLGNANASGSFSGIIAGGFGLAKTGTGSQILAGANTFSGPTSVNGGSLVINGSLGASSAVAVNSGGTLTGDGTVSGPVTLSSGATLAAGDAAIGSLAIANSLALHDAGTVALRVRKSGAALTSDRISLSGATGVVYKGALAVTAVPGSEPFAIGDKFTLFSKTAGTFTGSFATANLPTLGNGLRWEMAGLTVDGSIEVTSSLVAPPVFSLAGGNYPGPLPVNLSTTTAGASIRYTTDGSDPKTSGTAVAAVAPITVTIPVQTNVTLKAYAFKAGFDDSTVVTAAYSTINPDIALWINPAGGSWPVIGNWLADFVANGQGVTADFSTLDLTADAIVTLDGARTVGGLKFADATPSHNWSLNTGSGGPLTLAVTSGSPVVSVANQTATVNAVLTGNQGMTKSGAGTLAISAANTFTGTTTISQGRLALVNTTSLPATANIVIGDANSGATAPNLYLGNQIAPTFASLTVGSGVAGAAFHTSGWAPTISGLTTLNSPLTIKQYNGGYVHTGIQNNGKITGPGAGSGNDTLIFQYGGSQNFYWQTNNTAPNDFLGNIRVTGAPGNMNAQGGANGSNNVVIPDAAMVIIDAGCNFVWNNFGNNAVNETFDGIAGAGNMARNNSGGLITSLNLTINAINSANEGDRVFTGALSSLNSLTFGGTGTQVFGGANTYTGPTTINGGTLLINGSQANTATTVAAAGTLGGTGTLAGTVTNNGTLVPGSNGVGNLTINNTLTLAPGSKVVWEIANWTGAAGTGWDKATVTSLNLTATSASRVTIRPVDLALANFTDTNATFVLVQTTSGITGFSADKFIVDTTGLTLPHGTWAVQQSGNNLVLAYTASPDANANGLMDTWESARFGNAAAGANLPDADPDHDGLCNLMEYALNSDPLAAGASPLVHALEPLADGKHLRLTVPKNPAATNLTYIVETCGALNDWSAANTTVESNTALELIVRDNFTTTTAPRRFIRLRVSSQP